MSLSSKGAPTALFFVTVNTNNPVGEKWLIFVVVAVYVLLPVVVGPEVKVKSFFHTFLSALSAQALYPSLQLLLE